MTNMVAYDEGCDAYLESIEENRSPYDVETEECRSWSEGWRAAEDTITMKAKGEMSEPIMPLNENQPENISEVVLKDRSKFQFSIRSLLLFTLFVAMALTSFLMYRRMSKAEQELETLRNVAGYLKVEDETLFHALALDCQEPLTWKWRVFLPKGSKYSWNLASGNQIPDSGIPKNGMSLVSSLEQLPRTEGEGNIITVSIRKIPDPKNKSWLFTLSSRSTEGDKKGGVGTSISDDVMNDIFKAGCTDTQSIGNLKLETRKPGEKIILLKYRIGEKTSPNSWSTSSKPQPGFIIWLEERK